MKILYTLILCFFFFSVQSQSIDKYSISVKGTIDLLTDYYSEGIEVNAFSNSHLYSIGYYYGEDYEFLEDLPTEKYNQLNVLFGKYINSKNKKLRFQYQGGVGLFWATLRTDELDERDKSWLTDRYITKKVSTIGFPIKIGGRYILFSFLSIGIDLQCNLNFQKSIIRPMLTFEIGKLRSSAPQSL